MGATELAKPQFRLPNAPPVCSDFGRCLSGGNEQAASYLISEYVSGGGFADYEPHPPPYNVKAVHDYLSSGVTLPNSTWYNARGRGYPDVSAFGWNGLIIQHRDAYLISGTSMSCPIFAGIIAVLQADFFRISNRTLGYCELSHAHAQTVSSVPQCRQCAPPLTAVCAAPVSAS